MKLSTDLNIEKNNNLLLSQRIKELEKIINIKGDKESSDIIKQKNLLNELNEKLKNININNDKFNELLEEIRIKDKIISNYPIQLLDGEKLISVIFVSSDKKINYSIICKNTDKFSKIENMLYDAYPELIESENNFLINGKLINKYKSLDFNNIKNSDIIMVMKK